MKPWKIALALILLILAALLLRPLIEHPAEVETEPAANVTALEPSPDAESSQSSADPGVEPTKTIELAVKAPVHQDPAVTAKLAESESATNVDNRIFALVELSELPTGDPRVKEQLLKSLHHENADVRLVAVEAIRSQGHASYITLLQAELPQLTHADTRAEVKELIEYLQLPESYEQALNQR